MRERVLAHFSLSVSNLAVIYRHYRGGLMILATIGWSDSSSAALVLGDRIAPVRQLPGRQDAGDVLSLIRRPLTQEERKQLSAEGKSVGDDYEI